jgi:hypothetical protein
MIFVFALQKCNHYVRKTYFCNSKESINEYKPAFANNASNTKRSSL